VGDKYNLEIKFGKVIRIFRGRGGSPFVSRRWTTKARASIRIGDPSSSRPESMGIICGKIVSAYQLTRKCLAWGLKLQRWNLKRLAGVCINGGACGLIRQSTCNLTNVYLNFIEIVSRNATKSSIMVLHGCHQFVLWNAILNYWTNATFTTNFI